MKLYMVVNLHIHKKLLVTVHIVERPHNYRNELVFLNADLQVRTAPQMLQLYGFSPVWPSIWTFRNQLIKNVFPTYLTHVAFLTCLSPVKTLHFKCVCKSFMTVCAHA